MRLSLEQQELLNSLLENKEELKVLYYVIEQCVVAQELAVNKVMVTDQATEREVVYRRLKAEGAKKLLTEIGKICKV